MKNNAVPKKNHPVIIRFIILMAIYGFIVIPLSAHILNEAFYDQAGKFPAMMLFNLLVIAPMLIFADLPNCLMALGILSRWIDTLNTWVGRGVAWITFIVVLVVFADVVMRYAFNTSFVFTQELEWHLFAFIFLMGAGYTLLQDGHVRVDIIYQRLGPKAQAWINLIGVLFFLIPGCYMIIITSVSFVYNSWAVLEGSPDPGGIPYRFILKSAIPAGFVLILLQGISMGIKSVFTIMGKDMEKEGRIVRLERDCRS